MANQLIGQTNRARGTAKPINLFLRRQGTTALVQRCKLDQTNTGQYIYGYNISISYWSRPTIIVYQHHQSHPQIHQQKSNTQLPKAAQKMPLRPALKIDPGLENGRQWLWPALDAPGKTGRVWQKLPHNTSTLPVVTFDWAVLLTQGGELHFSWSFQGYPSQPYLALNSPNRSNHASTVNDLSGKTQFGIQDCKCCVDVNDDVNFCKYTYFQRFWICYCFFQK